MPDTMITTADVAGTAPAPKSLKALLREYRKAYKAWNVALKGDYARDMTEEQSRAYQEAAAAPTNAVREALIEAPVVGFDDIAMKLRFMFEIDDEDIDKVEPGEELSWEARIVKNILRDIEKPPTSVRDLHRQAKAAFQASSEADRVLEHEEARIRAFHPPCPHMVAYDVHLESGGSRTIKRPATESDMAQLCEQGDLTKEEAATWEADLRQWEAACRAIDAQHPSLTALEEAAQRAEELYDALDHQVIAAPAQSLDDIRAKLEFLAEMECMDGKSGMHPERLVLGLIRDLKRMTGAK